MPPPSVFPSQGGQHNSFHSPTFDSPDPTSCSHTISLAMQNVQTPPSPQTILTSGPKSVGTISHVDIHPPYSNNNTSQPPSRPPRIPTSTRANRKYHTTGEYVMPRVPQSRLRHFAHFLQQNASAMVYSLYFRIWGFPSFRARCRTRVGW